MKKFAYISVLFGLAALFTMHAHGQVVVVANASWSADSISKSDLRDVFTGASTTVHGAHIKPVLLKDGPVHSEFVIDLLGKQPVGFILVWRGLVLSGQSTMPKTFETEAALVDYVSKTPGAVGYVKKSTPHDSVKVLALQ